MHHRYVKYNFSIYFNFWDRVMGTNHPNYEKTFEKVIVQRNTFEQAALNITDPLESNLSMAEQEKVLN